MRDVYTKQLEELDEELVYMGRLLIEQVQDSMACFTNRDKELASKVISADKKVNESEKKIEQLSLSLLLLQAPMAMDLRNISASLKMITDMERIGDQAADIAEIIEDLHSEPVAELDQMVTEMYNEVINMLINAIKEFEEKRSNRLIDLIKDDDRVDEYLIKVKDTVIKKIEEKTEFSHDALDYIMVAKHLEKIADYTVHVIRWTYFFIEGVVPEKQ